MKTKQDKIKFQKDKLVKFDEITIETACAIGKICVNTKACYEQERRHERLILELKINEKIKKIK